MVKFSDLMTYRGWKVRIRRTPDSNVSVVSTIFFPVEIPEVRRRHRTASIRRATLRLLITTPRAYHAPLEGVTVNILLPPKKHGSAATLVEERQVHLTSGRDFTSRWMEFDLTDTVSNWVRDPASNKGLMIECHGCSFYTFSSVNDTSAKPRLNVFINVRGHSSRTKRSYEILSPKRRGRTDCRKDGERCCRHQMEVVFDQLKGFEFILQPKKFDAGFCKGRCPPRYNPAHHHALLQSLIWKQNRKLAPKPCCAPSKLKALEILRLDEDDPTRLKVSHWENIEVTECACS
ncbi:hypothetical protein J437_LFUL014480 [Ladona fulva]|uniref:TGF-beta family profile domain-containing protein n=1 Tax=Ladona fulva TaxID=123851 RepID=A0A8K0KPC9_LADFU|nr:hypothetical protein J437_LFUL014480 [Ladona fulva]